MSKTRTYKMPSEPGRGGWAKFIIDDDGYFSVVSDYGNYAFHWTAFGDDFREFLLDISPDYLMGKLSNGKMCFDLEGTKARIFEHIKEYRRDSYIKKDEAREMWDEIEVLDSEHDLHSYFENNSSDIFEEWWDMFRQDYPADLKGFATWVYPRFVAMLKAELAAEGGKACPETPTSK